MVGREALNSHIIIILGTNVRGFCDNSFFLQERPVVSLVLSWWGVLYTALCDKVCQWLATGRWFSPGTPVSSTNKTDVHDITKILLKVALNTTNPSSQSCVRVCITIKYRIFSTNETDRHDITKILLKVALNTTTVSIICVRVCIIIKYRKREKYVLYEGRSISVDHWYLILRLILP